MSVFRRDEIGLILVSFLARTSKKNFAKENKKKREMQYLVGLDDF